VSQRLLRRRAPNGGYAGRLPVAEFVRMDEASRAAVLQRRDATKLASVLSAQPGFASISVAAESLIAKGLTDAVEMQRVLGSEKTSTAS
jgi:type II secretory ATPase GspE/PulE/Tfp pilus assembly ATPase PilB-like protein